MTTWETLITQEMALFDESLKDIEASTLTDEQWVTSFDDGYGGTEGCAFTVWTKARVYFPVCYDGAEWVGSVARHPDGIPTPHMGGG